MGDLEDEAYNLIPRPFSVLIQSVHEYLCVRMGDLEDEAYNLIPRLFFGSNSECA